MAKDINLMSQEWIDLVFKNKAYGAYRLRQSSGRRHLFAFVVTITIVVVLFLVLFIITSYQNQKKGETMVQVTELSDIQLAPPELPEEDIVPSYVAPLPRQLKEKIKMVPPVIERADKVREAYEKEMRQNSTEEEEQLLSNTIRVDGAEQSLPFTAADDEDDIFTILEEQPEFPGGNEALARFLNDNLYYPLSARENQIEGRVLMNFIIEKDGRINHIEIVDSINPLLDDEAIRAIRSMPKWKPGKRKGQPVRVRVTLPIVFRL
jgi:TonB family C-terminal domain